MSFELGEGVLGEGGAGEGGVGEGVEGKGGGKGRRVGCRRVRGMQRLDLGFRRREGRRGIELEGKESF